MRYYVTIFDVTSAYIGVVILSAIFVFIHTYTTTKIETDRKKLRWMFLGFLLGPLSYLFLWVIPSRIWNKPFIIEEVVLLLVAFVPITFGIAIVKYRLMNVDIIFKRGLVYTIVISILLIIYTAMISIAAKLLNNPSSEVTSIIAAISIALLFQPAKERVQKLVNKKFFRVEYDYRIALNLFIDEIKDIYKTNELTPKVIELIDRLIPVNNIAFYLFSKGSDHIEVSAHKNIDHVIEKKINLKNNNHLFTNSLPLAKPNKVEAEAQITKSLPQEFLDLGADLVFIIKSSNNVIHGFLVLGEKKSETKFTVEDIDLLKIISARLALTFDRIKLQEEIIREHLETERLEELNKLKSYFVSSVSHDLKTPLTSIKMFAEILKSTEDISPQKVKEYLDIIEGESNRLTRLIDNVLDYSKIEKGIKKYNFKTVEINKVINEILNLMEYQFKIQKFIVEAELNSSELFIYADRDAIVEAIINIISNSIKFSLENKSLIISTVKEHNIISVKISDKGIGIPEDKIEKIFDPYFRSEKINFELNSGAGLGMSIVKHIMDAHRGRINIKSKVNEGTMVSLEFPIEEIYDEDYDN